jgi:hypothetical protein
MQQSKIASLLLKLVEVAYRITSISPNNYYNTKIETAFHALAEPAPRHHPPQAKQTVANRPDKYR